LNKVPENLSSEFAEFAMFSLDLGDCVERDGKPVIPSMVGKGVDLWEVKPQYNTIRAEVKSDKELAEQERLARLAKYIEQGYAFDENAASHPNEWVDENPSAEGDEWENFFGQDVEMRGGRCSRKGGVKNNQGFESFVDSAQ
jgi:hypothetical protein